MPGVSIGWNNRQEVLDEVTDKEIEFSASLSDIQMLEKWVKEVRKLEEPLSNSVIEEGKGVLAV